MNQRKRQLSSGQLHLGQVRPNVQAAGIATLATWTFYQQTIGLQDTADLLAQAVRLGLGQLQAISGGLGSGRPGLTQINRADQADSIRQVSRQP